MINELAGVVVVGAGPQPSASWSAGPTARPNGGIAACRSVVDRLPPRDFEWGRRGDPERITGRYGVARTVVCRRDVEIEISIPRIELALLDAVGLMAAARSKRSCIRISPVEFDLPDDIVPARINEGDEVVDSITIRDEHHVGVRIVTQVVGSRLPAGGD